MPARSIVNRCLGAFNLRLVRRSTFETAMAGLAQETTPDLLERLDKQLVAPLTDEQILGAYRVACFRGPNSTNAADYVRRCRQFSLSPHAAFQTLLGLPEARDTLNLDLLRENGAAFPIRLACGATVFRLAWDFFVSDSARRSGRWEPEVEAVMRRHLRPGDVALDIGGNIGCHTALMATLVGPGGAVHTFEPASSLFGMLQRMKGFNEFAQVHLYNLALSDRNGEAFLGLCEDNPGGNAITEPSTAGAGERVQVRRADDLLLRGDGPDLPLDRLAFVKLDVEGFEGAVLSGALELLARFRPVMVTEFAPVNLRTRGSDPAEFVSRLRSMDMDVSILGNPARFSSPAALAEYVEQDLSLCDLYCRPR